MKKIIVIGIMLVGILSYADTRIVFPGDIEKREINGKTKVFVKGESEALTGILKKYSIWGSSNEYYFVDGLPEGKVVDYYLNGRKAYERNMKNGLKDGLQVEYSYEGEKREEIYNMGVLEVIIEYYPNNLKKSECVYNLEGKKNGIELVYNLDGSINERILWENGEIIRRN